MKRNSIEHKEKQLKQVPFIIDYVKYNNKIYLAVFNKEDTINQEIKNVMSLRYRYDLYLYDEFSKKTSEEISLRDITVRFMFPCYKTLNFDIIKQKNILRNKKRQSCKSKVYTSILS